MAAACRRHSPWQASDPLGAEDCPRLARSGVVAVWVAARWSNLRPLRRAARHDGLFIIDVSSPSELASATDVIKMNREHGLVGFEVVVELGPEDRSEPWEQAGATWALTSFDPFTVTATHVRGRIKREPRG